MLKIRKYSYSFYRISKSKGNGNRFYGNKPFSYGVKTKKKNHIQKTFA